MDHSRRALLRGSALAAGFAALGAGAARLPAWLERGQLPLGGGYAPAADHLELVSSGQVLTWWSVRTEEPAVALTFDDGPGPHWTTEVLDILDEYAAPATFFMVGRNLAAHADLVRGRLDRHAVGNHSWSHPDLALLDFEHVRHEITRTHEVIEKVTGVTPTLLRPPYGHLGGSTLLAAGALGYHVVLWSEQMRERRFQHDPAGQARDIVDSVRPGSIVLAHDVGPARRLVALRQLGAMVTGLRRRGFRLVTVPELLTLERAPKSGQAAG